MKKEENPPMEDESMSQIISLVGAHTLTQLHLLDQERDKHLAHQSDENPAPHDNAIDLKISTPKTEVKRIVRTPDWSELWGLANKIRGLLGKD